MKGISHLILLVEDDVTLPLDAPAPEDGRVALYPPLEAPYVASNAVDLVPDRGGGGEGEDIVKGGLSGGDEGRVEDPGEDGDGVEVGHKLGG